MGLGPGQTRRSKHGAKSSSSTVLWDSATFLEDWKQQIKGKGSIPANQQRLTFASQRVNKEPVVLANFSPRRQWQLLVNATVEELCEDLQSWHAVLRTKNKSARLLSPLVLTERDNRASSLHSRTAQELRQIGVPCDVYYLSFDKWIPSQWPEISEENAEGVKQPREINCQIDEQFQQSTFFIDLDGQLNGEYLPMPLSYVMNGRDVTVKLSMLEQTARYREGQKIRHKITTPASKALPSLVKEENVTKIKSWGSDFENYVVHFEKDREFTAIISREHCQLRCIIVPVVTVPLHGANSVQEQMVGDSKGAIKESDSKTVALPSTSRRAGKVSSEVCEREFCGSIDTCAKMFHPSVLACTVTNGSGRVSSSKLDEVVERGSKKKKKAKKHLKGKLKNNSASNNNEEHKIGMMRAWKDKLSRGSRVRSNEFDNLNLQSVEDLDDKIAAEDRAASKEVVQVQGQKVKFPEHLDYGDLQGESSEPLEVSNKTFHNIQTTVRGLATCTVGHANVQVHADYQALHMVQALDSMDLENTDDGMQARTSLHLKEVDADAYNMGGSNSARSSNGVSVVDEWSKSTPLPCCPVDLCKSGATEVNHNSGEKCCSRDVVANVWTSGKTIQNCRSNEESLSCSQQTRTSDIEIHPSVETSSSMLDLDNIQDLRENRTDSANGGCLVNIFVSSSDTGTSEANGRTFSERILNQKSEKKSKCIASSVCGSKLGPHCRCSCLNCTPVTTGPSVCSAENSSLNSFRNGRTREDLQSSQDQGFQRSMTAENHIHNQGKADQFIFLPKSKLQMKENSGTDVSTCPGDFWAEKKPEGKFIHRKQVNQSPFRGVPGGNSRPFSQYSRHQRSKSDQLDHSRSRFAPMTQRLEGFSMDGGSVPHSCQNTNFSSLPQMLDPNLASGSTKVLMPCAALQDPLVPMLGAAHVNHVRDDSKCFSKPKEEPKDVGAVEASQSSAKSACLQSSRKEFKEFACKILEATCASFESQTVCENVTLATGIPLCEFEKVLLSVAPVFKDSPVSLETGKAAGCCCTHVVAESCRNARRCTICKHQIADVTLNTLWQWYEEPSCFGLEVKCGGCPTSENNNSSDTQFQAFFVPYLSGMQLFGCTRLQGITGPNDAESADGVEGRYSFGVNFHNPPEFPLLVPEPTIVNVVNNTHIITGGQSSVSLGQKVKSKEADCRKNKCGPISDDSEKCDVELLYEFFDGEKPQQRRPFIDRMKELAMGQIAPESCRFGDGKVLTSVTIGELHPASWFAVAWYPIYRIPDGTFRSAFLTYHSLSYLCCGCPASSAICGLSYCCMDHVTAPVVGLMSYNAQAEEWFSLTPEYKSQSKVMGPLDLNPSEIIQQHLAKLEAAAATMAKGSSDESSIFEFKHLDYSFFRSHQR